MNFFKKILKAVLVKCGNIYFFHKDMELINLFTKEEDECAFDEIINRYIDKIYSLVFRITKNKEMTEDVVQEIIVTLSQKLETFRGDSSFSTWLYRISTNAALMKLRSEKKYVNNQVIEDNNIFDENKIGTYVPKDSSKRPDTFYMRKEAGEVFDNALNNLPESYRIIIHLKDIEGFSYIEIADILEISVQAVKSRIHRARLLLRESLSEYFTEWSN
ncbi:MAG: RNA polymerase sigma factor [Thermodesulfobacteriota bacterium]